MAQSNFGPRAHAAIGYLGTVHNVSIRATAEIMETIFGLDISTGAVCQAAERVSEACVPVVNFIKRYTAQALYLNIDETGWKNKKERHYLWALVSPITVLFVIAASRGAKVLKEVLGEAFLGIIISDDHSAVLTIKKASASSLRCT